MPYTSQYNDHTITLPSQMKIMHEEWHKKYLSSLLPLALGLFQDLPVGFVYLESGTDQPFSCWKFYRDK